MELICQDKSCKRKWPYNGKKKFPAYTTCPDCKRPVKIKEGKK